MGQCFIILEKECTDLRYENSVLIVGKLLVALTDDRERVSIRVNKFEIELLIRLLRPRSTFTELADVWIDERVAQLREVTDDE